MSWKQLKTGLVVLIAASILVTVLLWLNLSRLTRKLAQEEIPGLTLGEVQLAWNKVELTDFRYVSGDSLVTRIASRSVDARPTFLSFLKDEIEIRELVVKSPQLGLVRRPSERPQPEPGGGAAEPAPPQARAEFRRVTLVDGLGEIEDRTVSGEPARLLLERIDVRLENLSYPLAAGSTAIDASCIVRGRPDGKAHLAGWLDPVNQSAELRLDTSSLDIKNLRPYFRDRVPTLEKADGTVDLRLDVSMTNGTYKATGELTLGNLHMPNPNGTGDRLSTLLLTQYLKFHGNRVTVPFKITGDLRKKEHRLDLSALLSGIINQEIGNEALQKKIGLPRSPEKLDQDLRRLKEQAKKLRKLF